MDRARIVQVVPGSRDRVLLERNWPRAMIDRILKSTGSCLPDATGDGYMKVVGMVGFFGLVSHSSLPGILSW